MERGVTGCIDHSATSWFCWSALIVSLSFFLISVGDTEGQTGPETDRGKTGGGYHYSMASWFSWSALMSSLASLPSLLLLLFLCLCLRWLSPSSLSCLLLLLLLREDLWRPSSFSRCRLSLCLSSFSRLDRSR